MWVESFSRLPLLAQAAAATPAVSLAPLWVVIAYLVLLVVLGVVSHRYFGGTSADYFVASRSIGSFLLLMSIFGTTMTAFALVGSTGKAYSDGIGTYGLMASWSGLIHSAVFFLVGIRLWAIGKRRGHLTQCQFFRDRFQSPTLGFMLFPVLVMLIMPYLLIGLIGAGAGVRGITMGMFPEQFPGIAHATKPDVMQYVGAIPPWLTGLVVSLVVLSYVFLGGVRSTAWANTFQTLIFMVTGLIAFYLISRKLGGLSAASAMVLEKAPDHLAREGLIGRWHFFSYCFIPLSVGMFPHLFQHWLTAKSAKTFRLSVIFHPIFIMIVWLPCILIGIWAKGHGVVAPGGNENAVLPAMVRDLGHPVVVGILMAGILAAIMSSLDSQFMCLSTMFTTDIVQNLRGDAGFTDKQKLWTGRVFVVAVVALTYLISLQNRPSIFALGVWCFSGFAGLFPLALAAIYWRRATKAGMIAGLLAGAGAWLLLFLLHTFRDDKEIDPNAEPLIFTRLFTAEGAHVDGIMPVVLVFAACAAAVVLVSLVTKPPPAAHVAEFFPNRAPSDA